MSSQGDRASGPSREGEVAANFRPRPNREHSRRLSAVCGRSKAMRPVRSSGLAFSDATSSNATSANFPKSTISPAVVRHATLAPMRAACLRPASQRATKTPRPRISRPRVRCRVSAPDMRRSLALDRTNDGNLSFLGPANNHQFTRRRIDTRQRRYVDLMGHQHQRLVERLTC